MEISQQSPAQFVCRFTGRARLHRVYPGDSPLDCLPPGIVHGEHIHAANELIMGNLADVPFHAVPHGCHKDYRHVVRPVLFEHVEQIYLQGDYTVVIAVRREEATT